MRPVWILLLFGSLITYHFLPPASGEGVPSTEPKPSFDQCKPYVDAALKTGSSPQESSSPPSVQDLPPGDDDSDEDDNKTGEDDDDSNETKEDGDDSKEDGNSQEDEDSKEGDDDTKEDDSDEVKVGTEKSDEDDDSQEDDDSKEDSEEDDGKDSKEGDEEDSKEDDVDSKENSNKTDEDDDDSKEKVASDEDDDDSKEKVASDEDDDDSKEGDSKEDDDDSKEGDSKEGDEDSKEGDDDSKEGDDDSKEGDDDDSKEGDGSSEETASEEDKTPVDGDSAEDSGEEAQSHDTLSGNVADQADESESTESEEKQETQEDQDSPEDASTEAKADVSGEDDKSGESKEGSDEESDEKSDEDDKKSLEAGDTGEDDKSEEDEAKSGEDDDDSKSDETKSEEDDEEKSGEEKSGEDDESDEDDDDESGENDESDEDDEDEVEPYIPRSRGHVTEILGLDDSDRTKTTFTLLDQATQITLKALKRIYENAIHPLEKTYKYRDLSNRHFGDPEIFSKPLIVFMGPWSGGKSTIINWLLNIKDEESALRTGADPSPAQFNIMMYGKEEEVLDGTQLAADWTFSGLQKFGQSFLDRLRGRKLPNRLLEKVNIVEIPGILEVRKQVERSFPFNDACQWFIDRADVLFLVYAPEKLDIGPETEAILDQLKGRESQVRIVLNKADTVTPDELLRTQAMLVWNISPLMSSAEPPTMYAASLWDRPLQPDSPKSLLTSHENNFLKDIKDGVEKQVETRIAAARRFAVRVRNHAKMVDCYLNTYHNHRSFFGDKKKITNDIVDHPQNYHIYEGLSTLTNISRYDLPDPETYKDFFKLNHLWDFPTLSSTCSYFKGCPINKLDIAIAYELPELLGKFRRQREAILTAQAQKAAAEQTK